MSSGSLQLRMRDVIRAPVWGNTDARWGTAAGEQPPGELTVDVAVIGGGITGLAAALILAKAGVAVGVFDRAALGGGASGRNAGFCTVAPPISASAALRLYGLEQARRLFQWFAEAVDQFVEFSHENSIRAEVARSGHIILAESERHGERLRRESEIISEKFGIRADYVKSRDLGPHLGINVRGGGLIDDLSASLDPVAFVRGLSRLARLAGARLYPHCEVTHIRPTTVAVEVLHKGGRVRADNVLVATDGYTRHLGRSRGLVAPVVSSVIATEPLDGQAAARLLPTGKVVSIYGSASHCFRLTKDRRLLFTGRGYDLRGWTAAAHSLHAAACRYLRGVEVPQVAFSWHGDVGVTPTRLPCVGKTADRVYFAGGYCGHGVPVSLACGRHVAERILHAVDKECPFYQEHLAPSWLFAHCVAVALYARARVAHCSGL